MYEVLLKNNNTDCNTAEIKWRACENIDITDWKPIYSNLFQITNDSMIQWFQYRLQNRILPLNSYLKTIGSRQCNKCNLCNNEIETIEHLFWECRECKNVWQDLQQWIFNKTNIICEFSLQVILFGKINNNIKTFPINYIILYSKYFIYISSRRCNKINSTALYKYLSQRYNIEKTLSNKNLQIDKFNKLWEGWQLLFI